MKILRPVFVALSFLILGCAFMQHAFAATDADALTARGVQLRRKGKDQEALPLFEEAVRQQSTSRGLGQLGFCEQALGLWVPAELHIQSALKDGHDPWIRKNEPALRESLSVVQAKLGSIEVWGTPSGARILLDNQPVSVLPAKQAIRAAEGRHILTIEAPNFLSDTRILNVRALALTREHVALAATGTVVAQALPRLVAPPLEEEDAIAPTGVSALAQKGDTPPSQSEPHLPTWRRALPWSLLAGAVIAGSVAVWQHTVWYNGLDRFNAIPGCGRTAAGSGSDMRCQGIYDDFSRARVRTFVGYGVAGFLGATAATIFILNATVEDDASASALALEVGPNSGALSISATF